VSVKLIILIFIMHFTWKFILDFRASHHQMC